MNTAGNGYYVVNNKIYTDKIQAILDAQLTSADITWHFYQDIFSKVSWDIEPEISLQEFYRIRAQQIRDKYDYVIVRVSGGADSTNAIWSFLNNGIHVDEVITDVPLSGLNNFDWNTQDTSPANTLSEIKFVTYPLLNDIKNKAPKTKITINDIFQDSLQLSAEKWINNWSEFINPVERGGGLQKYPHLVKLAEQGKKIGIVWGVDKPQIKYNLDRTVSVSIVDRIVNLGSKNPFDIPYTNVDRVLFYYTPELPEMMVKQCHVICKHIHKKENLWISDIVRAKSKLKNVILGFNPSLGLPTGVNYIKGAYQRAIAPIIYPGVWSDSIFQCEKIDGAFMGMQNSWFFENHKDTTIYQMMASEFTNFYKKIDTKYLDKSKNAFIFFSQGYKIGSVDKWLGN